MFGKVLAVHKTDLWVQNVLLVLAALNVVSFEFEHPFFPFMDP